MDSVKEGEIVAIFVIDGKEYEIEKKSINKNIVSASINGKEITIEIFKKDDSFFVKKKGVLIPVFFAKDESNNFYIQLNGEDYRVHQKTVLEQAENEERSLSSGKIEPPMPGKILKVMVKEGDNVEENQVLLLMESMKLQVEVKAPFGGKVKLLNVLEGQTVNSGELIVEIEKTV